MVSRAKCARKSEGWKPTSSSELFFIASSATISSTLQCPSFWIKLLCMTAQFKARNHATAVRVLSAAKSPFLCAELHVPSCVVPAAN
jgi:hypothetical protein